MSLRGAPRGPPSRPYKVLCVSGLHPKSSDDVVRDTLYREYKKYGDISVRLVLEPDERVAYVYFRNFEEARDARHSKSRIILFDKPAIVEPVYESRSAGESSSYSRPRPRSITPPMHYPHYRSRSPVDRYREPSYRDDYAPHYHYREYQPRPQRGRGGYEGGSGRGGYYQPRRGGYEGGGRGEYRKEKFPNYLTHIPPEDDPMATRTLFAGNLEINITEEEMRKIFGRYGHLVDVDIKRPPPGTGNAYAFIRYENLDMAHRAKLELSGQYIGKFQCKIGYGKINASSKVWVGGLGSWCSESLLWKEFDRFGAIKKIDYHKGEPWAHIYYEMLDAAQAAVQEMRGFPLGGPDKRLRIDFADLEVGGEDEVADDYEGRRSSSQGRFPSRSRYTYVDDYQGGYRRVEEPRDGSRHRSRGSDYSPPPPHRSELSNVQTIGDICRKTPKVWDGGLILKNSLFPAKLHLIEGDRQIADSLRGDDAANKSHLKITQRLRLDQSKLDDVTKRMNSSSSHAVFLGLSTSAVVEDMGQDLQSRPLRNLISYLKQKEAAGVISLSEVQQGVLYCFPPCAYSLELLRREAPGLIEEGKEDYLVVVVVCGSHVS